jgi:hypothetical protein
MKQKKTIEDLQESLIWAEDFINGMNQLYAQCSSVVDDLTEYPDHEFKVDRENMQKMKEMISNFAKNVIPLLRFDEPKKQTE